MHFALRKKAAVDSGLLIHMTGAEPGGGTMCWAGRGMTGGGGGVVVVMTGVICNLTVGPGSCGICTLYCLPAYSYTTL